MSHALIIYVASVDTAIFLLFCRRAYKAWSDPGCYFMCLMFAVAFLLLTAGDVDILTPLDFFINPNPSPRTILPKTLELIGLLGAEYYDFKKRVKARAR